MLRAPDSNCMTDERSSHLYSTMKLHSERFAPSHGICSLCGFHIREVVWQNRDPDIHLGFNICLILKTSSDRTEDIKHK